MPEIPQDRLCLVCEQRPIIGKPHSVYVCRHCYETLVHEPNVWCDGGPRCPGHTLRQISRPDKARP